MKKIFKKLIDQLKADNSTSTEESNNDVKANEITSQISEQNASLTHSQSKSEQTELLDEQETIDISGKSKDSEELKINAVSDVYVPKTADNAIELQNLTYTAIMNSLHPFFFGNTTIASLHFHLKHNRAHATSIACNIFTNSEFMEELKLRLSNNGIKYTNNLSVIITYASTDFKEFTRITEWLSVEVLTPGQSRQKHKIIFTPIQGQGILWDDRVEILPSEEPAYIGRCREPKLPSGISISNSIAFIGEEENKDPEYKINSYVSRSIAYIIYNKHQNLYSLKRSNLMENTRHVIKIIRISEDGVKEINVNNTKIPYPLQDKDQITFNGKVSLKVKFEEIS